MNTSKYESHAWLQMAMLETSLMKTSSSNRLRYYKIELLYVQGHNWVYAHAKIAFSLDRTGSSLSET